MAAFDTTRWSLILAGHEDPERGRESLEYLCSAYRRPVFAFVRRRGHSAQDAEDLTQGFFESVVARRLDAVADPARGRFRTLLLTALERFLSSADASARAVKRGGRVRSEALEDATVDLEDLGEGPEQAFERAWAMTLLERALSALRLEAHAAGRGAMYARLKPFLVEAPDPDEYAAAAADLGLRANTVAVAVHRLRRRLRELVRAAIAETLEREEDADDELEVLREVLGGIARGKRG